MIGTKAPSASQTGSPIYKEYTERLLKAGAAYFCDCDPGDLEERRKASLARGEKPRYDGRCRDRGLAAAPNRAVRFKTPKIGTTLWQDQIKGHIAFENQELDDLVIRRADGIPTYNLAVVVDDITMDGHPHHPGGRPHQQHPPADPDLPGLKRAAPLFGHMPLMLGKDRTKLSKRHGALPVLSYRDRGILPHTLNNYLARLGWSHGDQEIFSREELIEYFSLQQVGKAPGVHDDEKLLWLNSHYLKTSDDRDLARELVPFLATAGDRLTLILITWPGWPPPSRPGPRPWWRWPRPRGFTSRTPGLTKRRAPKNFSLRRPPPCCAVPCRP